MISSLHSCSLWMTDFEDEIIKLTAIVLLCSITLHLSKIGNTIDMPIINKGDFILANIPVDLPETTLFFLQYSSKLFIISVGIDNL